MAQNNLTNLVSDIPYFNSHELLIHWMTKCEQLISEAESILNIHELSRLLDTISREDFAFVVRCTHVHLIMKQLERSIYSMDHPRDEIRKSYEYLRSVFQPFLKAGDRSRDPILEAAGYDVKNVLTGPYPLYVSVMRDNGSNCPTESGVVNDFFNNRKDFLETPYVLADFSADELTFLKDSLLELSGLSPYLLFDVTMNVRLFAKIIPAVSSPDAKHMSLSTTYLPGICFFADGIFTNRESITESIFHEALHMKYLQTIEVHFLHPKSYTGDTGRSFVCSWRPKGNLWKFNRAFGAFHVYAHLYVYYHTLIAEGMPAYYRKDWVICRAAECRQRAGELRRYVEAEAEEAFTNDGLDFFAAICAAMDAA